MALTFYRTILILRDSIHFCQIVRVLPDYIFCPTKPSFSNSPALSPSPYLRELIHLTFRKNTTPFPAKNPATPPGIKVSAPATRRFPHAPSDKTDPHNTPSPPDTHPSKTLPNPYSNYWAYKIYKPSSPPHTPQSSAAP